MESETEVCVIISLDHIYFKVLFNQYILEFESYVASVLKIKIFVQE